MKIGYPCINRSIGCRADSTFRLASYSDERFIRTVENNLDCVEKILSYNAENGFLFFRISSETVPFATHPVLKVDWRSRFAARFRDLGRVIKRHGMRISMHPDQFVLINTPRLDVLEKSIADLRYHAAMLDLMELDATAKIQIHVGGVYGDKKAALRRFVDRYKELPADVKRRLVVENDDKLFSLADTLSLHEETGVPVLFDNLHHVCLNSGEPVRTALMSAAKTWGSQDGPPMIDYSDQDPAGPIGKHAPGIDVGAFRRFLDQVKGIDVDVMLEIKDKEASALKAREVVR